MIIPYGRHDVTPADIRAVEEVLRSDFLTQGPVVPRFEHAVAEMVGARHAVAGNSATSVLHLACLALGIEAGDRVWTSPITFVASANCARYCGGQIDFVDIDPKTYNLSAERLADKLASAELLGTLPKLVVAVHLAGQSCASADLKALADRYGFRVVEDASHAIGGQYRGRPVGGCAFSDVTVFSFHPVKIVTTGEGGMALTNDPALARRMARLATHGITRDTAEMSKSSDGPWYYEQIELGFNYRMTDIQAALGLSQLKRLDDYVVRRHVLAARYDELVGDLPIRSPWRHPDTYSAFHLYIIRLQLGEIRVTQREVFEHLRSKGILVNLHYIPLYRQPDFARFGIDPRDFPESERYYGEAVSLPLYPALTFEQQDYVVEALREVVK